MAMRFGLYGNECILVPHATQYNLTSAISICAWINVIGTLSTTSFNNYITKNDFYGLQYSSFLAGSEMNFQYAGPAWRSINDNITPTLNTWFHLVGTYDTAAAGNNFIIYNNGILRNSIRFTDSILTTAGGISIASLNAARYTNGLMADVRIYNRALSANEVATIHGSQGHDGIHYGLVGRWMFDEGYDGESAGINTGNIKDISDYKNNGSTING